MAAKKNKVEPKPNGETNPEEESALLHLKRAVSTDDGVVFTYLANQRQPQTDLACEAIRPYWLPLALKEQGVKGEELKSVGQKAIAHLMQQMEIIRLECGLSPQELPFAWSMFPYMAMSTTSRGIDDIKNSAEYDESAPPPPLDMDDFDLEDEFDSDVMMDDF